MASRVGWTSILAGSTLAASAELDNLADGANASGSLISASQYMYSNWFFHTEMSVAASGHVELYFIGYMGGSAANGGATVDPGVGPDATFPLNATAGGQSVMRSTVLLPNTDFHPLIINETGSNLSGSNNFLYFEAFDINPDV